MTFTDKTARSQTESIAFEFDLPHPPEKVWRALTEPELLAEWLLPAIDFELEPDAPLYGAVGLQAGAEAKLRRRALWVEDDGWEARRPAREEFMMPGEVARVSAR